MAEANRAYAERDEDRLRLILRVWERSPDAIVGDDPEANRLRLNRRLEELGARLVELEAELADLRDSAIARLKRKIDGAREQGWDLFAEMIRQVKREIAASRARLASLRR
jgi:F0F1-type ATP synthase membrane subunit b/b'